MEYMPDEVITLEHVNEKKEARRAMATLVLEERIKDFNEQMAKNKKETKKQQEKNKELEKKQEDPQRKIG